MPLARLSLGESGSRTSAALCRCVRSTYVAGRSATCFPSARGLRHVGLPHVPRTVGPSRWLTRELPRLLRRRLAGCSGSAPLSCAADSSAPLSRVLCSTGGSARWSWSFSSLVRAYKSAHHSRDVVGALLGTASVGRGALAISRSQVPRVDVARAEPGCVVLVGASGGDLEVRHARQGGPTRAGSTSTTSRSAPTRPAGAAARRSRAAAGTAPREARASRRPSSQARARTWGA